MKIVPPIPEKVSANGEKAKSELVNWSCEVDASSAVTDNVPLREALVALVPGAAPNGVIETRPSADAEPTKAAWVMVGAKWRTDRKIEIVTMSFMVRNSFQKS